MALLIYTCNGSMFSVPPRVNCELGTFFDKNWVQTKGLVAETSTNSSQTRVSGLKSKF